MGTRVKRQQAQKQPSEALEAQLRVTFSAQGPPHDKDRCHRPNQHGLRSRAVGLKPLPGFKMAAKHRPTSLGIARTLPKRNMASALDLAAFKKESKTTTTAAKAGSLEPGTAGNDWQVMNHGYPHGSIAEVIGKNKGGHFYGSISWQRTLKDSSGSLGKIIENTGLKAKVAFTMRDTL